MTTSFFRSAGLLALLACAVFAAPRRAPLVSIPALKRGKPGVYRVRGVVAKVFVCPPCPEDAHCEPCPPDHLVLSAKGQGELFVLAKAPARFRVGRTVELTVRLRPARAGVGGVAGEGVELVEPVSGGPN